MSFVLQRDDLPGEAVLGVGGVLSFWPRVFGTGNVTATQATYELFDFEGSGLGSGSATITAVGTPSVSRIDVPVSAGAAGVLSEQWPNTCRVAWRIAGDTTDRVSVLIWETVRCPFAGEDLVSLSDLQSVRPTIGLRLRKFGVEFLGYTGGTEAEQAAATFAYNARVELEGRVRVAASELGTVRSRLILDRARLSRVETLLCVALVFEADAKGIVEEADDEASQLARYYRTAADQAWRALGPLQYDSDEDGTPDTVVEPGNSLTLLRRVQG